MANVIAVLVIVSWIAFTIAFMVKDWRKSKREGTPMACFSCSAYTSGTCNHKCHSSSDIDKMIERAKQTLQEQH